MRWRGAVSEVEVEVDVEEEEEEEDDDDDDEVEEEEEKEEEERESDCFRSSFISLRVSDRPVPSYPLTVEDTNTNPPAADSVGPPVDDVPRSIAFTIGSGRAAASSMMRRSEWETRSECLSGEK